jgi:hypothetical protein
MQNYIQTKEAREPAATTSKPTSATHNAHNTTASSAAAPAAAAPAAAAPAAEIPASAVSAHAAVSAPAAPITAAAAAAAAAKPAGVDSTLPVGLRALLLELLLLLPPHLAGLLRTPAAHPPPHAAASALVVDDNDAHLLAATTTPTHLRAPPELLLLPLLLPLQPHAPTLAAPDYDAGTAPAPATTRHWARHLLLRPATPKLEGGATTTATAAATASSGRRRGKPAARGNRVGPVVLGLLHRCLQEILAALFSRSTGSLSREPLQLHGLLLPARQRRAALLLLRAARQLS